MNQQLWESSNSIFLDICECLKWNAFPWTLNTDQMHVNKDICSKADLYVYKGERNKDLVGGSRFLDCVTFFTYSSNSTELWAKNTKFLRGE